VSIPSVQNLINGYQFVWSQEQLRIIINRIIEDRRGSTSAEVTAYSFSEATPGHLGQDRINLLSSRAKKLYANTLRQRTDDTRVNWDEIVEQFCVESIKRHRQGEPIVPIGKLAKSQGKAYIVDPLILDKRPTVIYGRGGSFKSYLGLILAVMVQSGTSILGMSVQQRNVLLLDYETSAEEANERMLAICRGFDIEPVEIQYRFCHQMLESEISYIQDVVNRQEIGLVIVDSVGAACGFGSSDPADPVVRMFSALRSLRCSVLLLDHVAKNSETTTPYGSIYKENYSRSMWELRRSNAPNGIRVGLYHRKVNNAAFAKPIGLSVTFENDEDGCVDTVLLERMDITSDSELASGLSDKARILNILQGGLMTAKEIAERIGKPSNNIRSRLGQMKDKEVVKVGDKWALLSEQEIGF
jgi:hypothetical protein